MPVPNSIKVQRCKNKDIKQKDANADQHSFLCIHLGNNLFKTEIIHYHSIPCLFFECSIQIRIKNGVSTFTFTKIEKQKIQKYVSPFIV